MELDYPSDKLFIFFVTDGSNDQSSKLVKRYPEICLLHEPERKGKLAAIKRAIKKVNSPIVIFSDANTLINKESIRCIVSHYNDPAVGGVAGEKKIISRKRTAVGAAEGWYWQYESYLKKLDASLNTVVGAAGELFSIRTSLFPVIADEWILDDFIISMEVCLQGYKIAYEPRAFAIESPSASMVEEEKRKVRIAAGAFQSIGYLNRRLMRYPLLAFQFITRRLFRWVASAPLLIIFLFSNLALVSFSHHPEIYNWTMITQLLFYGLALIGGILARSGSVFAPATIPFYFVFMNYCLVKGFIRFYRGRQTVLWEKSLRQAIE
jgi:biofilm PGA synthesis N-glycosyltransferase PgaC